MQGLSSDLLPAGQLVGRREVAIAQAKLPGYREQVRGLCLGHQVRGADLRTAQVGVQPSGLVLG